MHPFGLFAGLASLLLIGLGFPMVILGERYLGYFWWSYLLAAGVLLVAGSLFIQTDWLTIGVGLTGAIFIWGSTELKGQAARVEMGWFPSHPRKIPPPFIHIIKKWKAPQL